MFEGRVKKGFFLGYSSKAKSFRVFNLSRQIVEESIHVSFDEDSYIQERINQLVCILNELILIPYDTLSEPIIPIINLVMNYYSNADDQAFNSEDQVHSRDQAFTFEEHSVLLKNQSMMTHPIMKNHFSITCPLITMEPTNFIMIILNL